MQVAKVNRLALGANIATAIDESLLEQFRSAGGIKRATDAATAIVPHGIADGTGIIASRNICSAGQTTQRDHGIGSGSVHSNPWRGPTVTAILTDAINRGAAISRTLIIKPVIGKNIVVHGVNGERNHAAGHGTGTAGGNHIQVAGIRYLQIVQSQGAAGRTGYGIAVQIPLVSSGSASRSTREGCRLVVIAIQINQLALRLVGEGDIRHLQGSTASDKGGQVAGTVNPVGQSNPVGVEMTKDRRSAIVQVQCRAIGNTIGRTQAAKGRV